MKDAIFRSRLSFLRVYHLGASKLALSMVEILD